MADVVAVSTIHYGYEEDDDGRRLPLTKKIGDKLTEADFGEEGLKALIACGSAVDLSGEMQELVAVPFVDKETKARDELLAKVGAPILVDTSNPTNRGVPAPQIEGDSDRQKEIDDLKEQLAAAKAANESNTTSKTPIGAAKGK